MPTPSEQKALAFVAIVILLGGAVRVVRANASAAPSSDEQQALAAQASAVDSAAVRKSAGRRAKSSRARRDTTRIQAPVTYQSPSQRMGFPPPGPRIDIGPPARPLNPGTIIRVGAVDLDVASAREIEALPHIGPAMARRIVAHRDSFGPYGSLDALQNVKGLGKATLEALRSKVTFSGREAGP